MKIFVNSNERVTVLKGSVAYELQTGLGQSLAIVECYLRCTHGEGPFCPPNRETLERAIEALIECDCTVANRRELESKDDPRMLMLNRNVNPTGQASPTWPICR